MSACFCHYSMAVILLFFCEWILIASSQQHDTTLQFHLLDMSFPMKTHSGIGAIYENVLYAFNGFNCTASWLNSCTQFTKHIQVTLDVSSIQIYNNSNEVTFIHSPSWIIKQIAPLQTTNAMKLGTGTSTSTYLNQYAYMLHPGCCTFPTDVALKYNLKTNQYINLTQYDSIIPGRLLTDSCNTNDGIYIYSIGGKDASMAFVSDKVYQYHIIDDIWNELADIIIARWGASCTFVRNELYVLGGQGINDGTKLKTIELYTKQTNQWNVIESTLYTARNQHISVTHPNNWIITIGGWDNNNNAAMVELFDPSTGLISTTDTMYARKQFYHAVYEYNVDTYIVFVFGGNFNGLVFDDIQYMVISSGDTIFPLLSTTTTTTTSTSELPMNTSDGEESITSTISTTAVSTSLLTEDTIITMSNTLLIILICIGFLLLIFCIIVLIFMICQKNKNNKRRNSRVYKPKSPKSPRSPMQRFRDMSRIEGAPKLKNNRKSSEGMRKRAIDEETNKYIDDDYEMNKLIKQQPPKHSNVDTESEEEEDEDSSIEKMYGLSIDQEEQKSAPKATRIGTYSMNGENYDEFEEQKNYHWIESALKQCDEKNWKIYLKHFKKNKVTEIRLLDLNDEGCWIELIPELGARIQFQQLWEERKIRQGYTNKTPGYC